jgi:hypothetical protein
VETAVTAPKADADRATRVAPLGWTELADAGSFYPADLPDDWRLTYYANAFSAVLVPHDLWSVAPTAALAGWRDDVHAGFRFFLESADDPQDASAAVRAALGGTLEALVGPASGADGIRSCRSPRPSGAPQGGYAAVVPDQARGDLRSARRWVRDLILARGEPARLLILTRPSSTELARWQDLLVLLGLAP